MSKVKGWRVGFGGYIGMLLFIGGRVYWWIFLENNLEFLDLNNIGSIYYDFCNLVFEYLLLRNFVDLKIDTFEDCDGSWR